MQFSFEDKVFLVTGGAAGIGREVVRRAAAGGARVAIVDRDLNAAARLQAEFGDRAIALGANVAVEAECARAVQDTREHFGALDAVVNSAGVLEPFKSSVRQSLEDWQQVIAVNLQGTFIMARESARAMGSRGGGTITNIASVAGLVGFRASNAYGVAKAGVAMMTRTLALDLASKGIRVNAVAPGFIETDMLRSFSEALTIPQSIEKRTPLGRYGKAGEVADVICFLASDAASFVTGVVLPVDGGWTAFGGLGDAS